MKEVKFIIDIMIIEIFRILNNSKIIFEKCGSECNNDNKNKILSHSYKFDDTITRGLFKYINVKMCIECQV